jgi:hypothetical protein
MERSNSGTLLRQRVELRAPSFGSGGSACHFGKDMETDRIVGVRGDNSGAKSRGNK